MPDQARPPARGAAPPEHGSRPESVGHGEAAFPPGNGRDVSGAASGLAEADEDARTGELEAKVVDLEDRWRRALADLDNLRKRLGRELDEGRAAERARVAAEWLPIIDNLDLALTHAQAESESLVDGIRAVRDQAVSIIGRLGFPRQAATGGQFDPAQHEAVSTTTDSDAAPGTVVHVVRPGYGEGDRQLRPASVVVATKGD